MDKVCFHGKLFIYAVFSNPPDQLLIDLFPAINMSILPQPTNQQMLKHCFKQCASTPMSNLVFWESNCNVKSRFSSKQHGIQSYKFHFFCKQRSPIPPQHFMRLLAIHLLSNFKHELENFPTTQAAADRMVIEAN